MKKIDKAFELHEEVGIDPDEIMLRTKDELEAMFPGEIDFDEPKIDTSELQAKLDDVLIQIRDTNLEIKNLLEVEIPEAQDYADSAKGYEAVDAHNDLQYANQSLTRAQKKLKELTDLKNALEEQIRRINHPYMDMYDEPEEFGEETDRTTLDELRRKLISIESEIADTEKCLQEEKMDYMRKKELDEDLRYWVMQKSDVEIKIKNLEIKLYGDTPSQR